MSNNKQSAVDWLIEELGEYFPHEIGGIEWVVRKAKEMEKQQMIKIYHEYQDYLDYEFKNQQGGQGVILTFEQYYNETYGGNK